MPEIVYPQESGEPVVVDLKDPYWGGFFRLGLARRWSLLPTQVCQRLPVYDLHPEHLLFLVLESDKVASYMPHSNQVICGGNLSVN